MGYILPISQYEYVNYQVRDSKDKQQTQAVERPYKVILEAEQEKLLNENRYRQGKLSEQTQIEKNHAISNSQIDVMLYARITGKGGIIDKVI